MNSTGNLVLSQNDSDSSTVVWYTTSQKQAQYPVAELLDSGNLVIRNEGEADKEAYLWQSFDYPCDTFLPEMKLGWDLKNGLERRLTSWKSPNDPSPGEFYRGLVLNNYPEFYLMNGTEKFFRFGPWNGLYFSGTPSVGTNPFYDTQYVSKNNYMFVSNKDELFYMYSLKNNSIPIRSVINQTSYTYEGFLWDEDTQAWESFGPYPGDICDKYGHCGPNGICRISESKVCQCLEGFSWKDSQDWTRGCVRNKPLTCKDKHNDWFVKLLNFKVPDTSHTWVDENMNLEECKEKCLNNCSCTAYANSDIKGTGNGCVLWFGDLIDIKQFEVGGQDLYIRMPALEKDGELQNGHISSGDVKPHNGRKRNTATIVVTTIASFCGILLLSIYIIYKVRRNIAEKSKKEDDDDDRCVDKLDLPLFDLQTIQTATNNFLINNKIGKGGFGPTVYWGKLPDGQEIAVKRLSRSSKQGMTEFINEVKLIAKLQHRNLVKLLGCCIQGYEKLLVYKYMANGSLDSFIFDHSKGKLLQWPHHFNIILGIARGLLYLHQDSRLRIIHRDLKSSNVLLDDKLNPKISDFGMARAFGGDQTEGNTERVVGTYGYMAPEYAVDGLFSIKSDVFSFGILLLEVISGNRNRILCHANDTLNLVGYAWTLWKEDKALELIDSNIKESCTNSEVLRCIKVSLLCVQQYPEDRPTMTAVVQMLGSEMEIAEPKEPGFFPKKVSIQTNLPLNHDGMSSEIELTNTSLSGRFERLSFLFSSSGYDTLRLRDNPIDNPLGILTMKSTGDLELSQNDSIVWRTALGKQVQNPVAELLDNGNLVIRNEGEEGYLWQSFDYPSDTILPGLKLGWDLRNGQERRITSWKSTGDPSLGDISWGLVLNNYPEFYIMKGTEKYSRTGPWNGVYFSGLPHYGNPNPIYDFQFVGRNNFIYGSNKDELFYTFTLKNTSVFVTVNISQFWFQTFVYIPDGNNSDWMLYASSPRDECDIYGICGPYTKCIVTENPFCQCLQGFSPKSPQGWNSSDWSQGCVRNKPLSCEVDDFVKFVGLKVPATTHTLLDENINLEACRVMCLSNCSCTAYANSDIRGAGSGCVMWFEELIDIRQFDDGGQDLYIRMSGSELDAQHAHNNSVTTIIATTTAAISGLLLFCIYAIYRIRRKIAENSKTTEDIERHLDELDLPLFDLSTLTIATNSFSLNNKIGQGGFGSVYKGKLLDGRDIAVKRLSSSSGQGITEFITEVKLIAKLQHRNLVKLHGCCIRGQEKLLIYEYMANGSLDSFIFDQIKGELLEWPQRFHIIFGVARGLMYLHQDSRLRIIHRDLKASNVLLDDKLNPKISDFGMARSFGGDQIEGNTNRIVGTYGYMAPEYAVDGLFSIKSDVFSFGILLLEIICGNKNRALCHRNQTLNLVGYAWTLWKEGNTLQLIDSRIKDSCVVSEVLQCIHVSLLCVQQYPEDRPTMTSVVQMLGSEKELVDPKEPGFFPRNVSDGGNSSSNQNEMSTNDELTITSLNGR
ncbi:S-locus glycoprotein domain [Sesbania bispinosa]|nr:S-locus glycoprotein domain [Sesbania bispinosa]